MSKILFNLHNKQQLVEVGPGGGVTSDADILWNEIVHGPIPAYEVGKTEVYFDESERKLRILPSEITSHSEAIAVEQTVRDSIEAKAYLASTDWYIIRELDSGEPCPQEIKDLRSTARLKV